MLVFELELSLTAQIRTFDSRLFSIGHRCVDSPFCELRFLVICSCDGPFGRGTFLCPVSDALWVYSLAAVCGAIGLSVVLCLFLESWRRDLGGWEAVLCKLNLRSRARENEQFWSVGS
jgi:hypothetical protein